jgi:hypothetical protein
MKKFLLSNSFFLSYTIIPAQSRDDVLHTIQQVTSQEKFQYGVSPDSIQQDSNRLRDFFANVIEEMVKLFQANPGLSLLGLIFVGIVILGAVLLLLRYAGKRLTLQQSFKTAGKNKQKSLRYQKEFARANQLLDAGKYREAVSAALVSLWLYFHHLRIFTYDESCTNREQLKSLYTYNHKALLKDLVVWEEGLVFAKKDIEKSDVERFFSGIQKIFSL